MKKYILSFATALLLLTGCSNSDYELQNLVPGQYHKIIVLKNSGKVEKTLLDVEDDDVTSLTVLKVGSDPSLTADVQVRPLTDEELKEEYSDLDGVNYKQLSSDCYSLSSTDLSFSSSDRYKTFTLSVHPHETKTLMASDKTATWVVPLTLDSKSDSINAESKEYVLIVKDVVSPSVGFTSETPAMKLVEKSKAADYTETLKLGLDTDNKWGLECKLAVDESYVATYNKANGTNLDIMPVGYYEIPSTIELANGSNSADVPVKIKAGTLPAGDYILPIAITETSRFAISSNKIVPLIVSVLGDQLDRSSWTATANTQESSGEGAGNGVPACLFDGKKNTYWHSQWSGGSHAMPYVIDIDMKSLHTIDHVSFIQRQYTWYADTKTVEVYVSEDNSTWTKVETLNLARVIDAQLFKVPTVKARYIRLNITSSHRGDAASLAEFYVYGE